MKKISIATGSMIVLALSAFSVFAQTQSRDDVIKELEAKRAELAVLEQKILAVADSDQSEFAAFLSQPQTGIFRLLPREVYMGNTKRGLAHPAGGALYSFVNASHAPERVGYDIQLEYDILSVGFAGADYGLIVNVGDTPLDQIVPEHATVRALLDYTPARVEADARSIYQKVGYGMDVSGVVFKSRLPAKVSNTYLLRSISYDRSDIAVAFRITRKDTDGSLIIIYKVLKNFPVPKLQRTQTASQ
jgi:hypothetical protein